MVALWQGAPVFLIHQRDCIGGTRVKASKGHITSRVCADVGMWFISSFRLCEQAFNLSLDWGVGNMPVHPRTVDGWKE